MGIIKARLAMSLDGYITGPNPGRDNPLGDGGERIHEWVFPLAGWQHEHGLEGGEQNRDSEIVAEANQRVGAVIMGRRMLESGEEPWGEEPPFHAPVFVLTSTPREPLVRKGGTTFAFITDGPERALEMARQAAGEQDISIAGGAETVRWFLREGELDELLIHLSPIMLGDGVRLFDGPDMPTVRLAPVEVHGSEAVTHLRYRPVR